MPAYVAGGTGPPALLLQGFPLGDVCTVVAVGCHRLAYPLGMTGYAVPPSNALALAGFIVGVGALVVTLLSWPLPVTVLVGLLAIIFGFVGITRANRLNGKRKRLAVWSVVLGCSPLVVPIVAAYLFGIIL